jgi:hypothetical protein
MILSTITIIEGSSGQSEPLAIPEVRFVLTKESYNISIEPGVGDGKVTITGYIECKVPQTVPQNIDCQVHVTPKIHHLEVEGKIDYVFTKAKDREAIEFVLTTPPRYEGHTQLFTLEGFWQYEGGRGRGEISSVWAYVLIERYGSVDIYSQIGEQSVIDIKPSAGTEVYINIHNHGNDVDQFTLTYLSDIPGLNVEFENETFSLDRGSIRRMRVFITTPDTDSASGTLTIKARSGNPGINSADQCKITILIKNDKNRSNINSFILPILLVAILIILLLLLVFWTRNRNKPQIAEILEDNIENG